MILIPSQDSSTSLQSFRHSIIFTRVNVRSCDIQVRHSGRYRTGYKVDIKHDIDITALLTVEHATEILVLGNKFQSPKTNYGKSNIGAPSLLIFLPVVLSSKIFLYDLMTVLRNRPIKVSPITKYLLGILRERRGMFHTFCVNPDLTLLQIKEHLSHFRDSISRKEDVVNESTDTDEKDKQVVNYTVFPKVMHLQHDNFQRTNVRRSLTSAIAELLESRNNIDFIEKSLAILEYAENHMALPVLESLDADFCDTSRLDSSPSGYQTVYKAHGVYFVPNSGTEPSQLDLDLFRYLSPTVWYRVGNDLQWREYESVSPGLMPVEVNFGEKRDDLLFNVFLDLRGVIGGNLPGMNDVAGLFEEDLVKSKGPKDPKNGKKK